MTATAFPAPADRPAPQRNAYKIRRNLMGLLLHVSLLSIGIVYLYPFLWTVGSAFKTPGEFFSQGISPLPAGALQFENFVKAWNGANFSRYFLNTVFISVSTSVLVVLITSMAAYSFLRLKIPGKKYIVLGLLLIFLLPRGFAILPVYQIIQALGLLNSVFAVIILHVSGGMLINTVLFYGFMRNLPHELEEAAVIDGATIPQRYRYVILPLSSPMIATVALFSFLGAWNDFFTSLIFTFGNRSLWTLGVGMYGFVGEHSRDWVLICAGATISLLPVIIMFVVMQRFFVNAFAGAIRG